MSKRITFIDSRVADYETLIDGLEPGSEYHLIDAYSDGITQIAAYLQNQSGIDAIHIVSHGSSGALYLGNAVINGTSLDSYTPQLATICKSLTDSGDLLLYGCNVAQGGTGQAFIEALAQATSADVAASENPIGAVTLGGDWLLEASSGSIEAQELSNASYFRLLGANTAPTFVLGDGKLTTDFGADYDSANIVTAQADGKILVAGTSVGDFALARYNANGSLDTDFDSDGRLTIDFGTAFDTAKWVSVQSDGKILVAGASGRDFAGARFNSDGSPDGRLAIHGSDEEITSIALQADGKFLSVGSSYTSQSHYDISLNRYQVDGALDLAFGGDGTVSTDMGSDEIASSALIQLDGKIVVTGKHYTGSNGRYEIVLLRYNADGTLDAGFGIDGQVTTSFSATSNNKSTSLLIQSDGKILVAGSASEGIDTDFAIARFNTDGSLDDSFGDQGKVVTAFDAGNEEFNSIVQQADGRILAAGYSNGNFALVRYTADGTLDTSFSDEGILTTNFTAWTDSFDRANSVVVQSDGKILVAGISDNGITRNDAYDFALARYNVDGSLDTAFDTGNPIYIVGDAAVILNPNAQVYDAELAAIDNYAGATISLGRHGGPSVEDMFSAVGNLGPLTEGASLVLSGLTIGTVTTNSAGKLLLTFNDNATQARVNETLSSLAYENHSASLPGGIQIDWLFSDGNTGEQGIGAAITTSGNTSIDLILNHAPTLADPIADQIVIADSAFFINVPTNTFVDVDAGDSLDYDAKLFNGTALPDWLVFGSTSSSFSGVAPSSAVGELDIQVTVSDSSGTSAFDVFRLTVANPISGSNENDTITGTTNPDEILGLGGNDRLTGAEGNDILDGGAGDDILIGEDSASNLTGTGYGGKLIVISSNTHVDVLIGGDGNDYLDDWIGDNTMIGGAGNDTYVGSFTQLIELADGGNDTILSYITRTLPDNVENLTLLGTTYAAATGNELNNTLIGNSGRNVLVGGDGADTIDGGLADDKLSGGPGADNLQGGEGDDTLFLASVSEFAPGEVINGGGGLDELWYTGDTDATLVLTANVSQIATVRIASAEGDWSGTAAINVDTAATEVGAIHGNAGDNILIGNAQENSLYGSNGNDTLNGGKGNDLLIGGTGNDTYVVDASGDIVSEIADAGLDKVYSSGSVTLPDNVEAAFLTGAVTQSQPKGNTGFSGWETKSVGISSNATGNEEDNVLGGNSAANRLGGHGGNDYLGGAGGNDLLIGGAGSDTLYGGSGQDVFLFDSLLGIDRLMDFSRGDTLRFNAAAFTGLTIDTSGTLAESAFAAGKGYSSARDSDDRIVFDTNTGALYYDADGVGGTAAIQVALLLDDPSTFNLGWGLTAASIGVV